MSGWWLCEVCVCPIQDGHEKRRKDEKDVEHIYCKRCDAILGAVK